MKKKKILLLSDDLRMHSGIATQSKEFVMGTLHKYDWVQLAGAVKHPEEGKVIDMSQAVKNEYGIDNAYLKLYPVSGYGSQNLLRQLLHTEKPDAIVLIKEYFLNMVTKIGKLNMFLTELLIKEYLK